MRYTNIPSATATGNTSIQGSQVPQLRKRCSITALRKAGQCLLLGLAVWAVVLIRLLRPLVLVRFASLRGNRIGHYAANTEMYLCERDAGLIPNRTYDIFFHASPPSNLQLKKMWCRVLHVSGFARYVDWVNCRIPGGKPHAFQLPSARDTQGLLARTPVHLSFTKEEEAVGRKGLLALGVPDGAPFVCFAARDGAYLDAEFPHMEWQYHDYRNSNIQDYVESVTAMTTRGYFALRMGALVEQSLNSNNPMIIDYASCGRTQFMDIYLSARCKWFLGSGLGIDAVTRIFRRPVAYVNYAPLELVSTWGCDDLFILKTLRLTQENRFMTFREILESGAGRYLDTEQYRQAGIEIVDNSPQEIADLALEMDDRLNGIWETTQEDEDLQRKFWSLFKPSDLNGVFLSRIGAKFLRDRRELLD